MRRAPSFVFSRTDAVRVADRGAARQLMVALGLTTLATNGGFKLIA